MQAPVMAGTEDVLFATLDEKSCGSGVLLGQSRGCPIRSVRLA